MGTADGAASDAPVSTTREYAGVDAHTVRQSVERVLAERADGDVRSDDEPATDDDASSAADPRRQLTATVRSASVDAGAIPYRPYGPHSAMVIVVSFVFMIPTVFLSLLVAGVALYLYYRERPMDLPLERRDVVRVDVAEDDLESAGATVTYAVDTSLSVDADRVAELSWPRRIATMNYVNHWYNLVADEPVERDVNDTVMGYLTAWANRDPEAHADTVRSFQERLADDPDRRREYTELLADQLPGVDDELEAARDSLRADLEGLADDVVVELENA